MPNSEAILAVLAYAARVAMPVSIAWHVVVGVALVAIFALRWRPSRRAAAMLLPMPLASVAAVSFAVGNPFNGVVLAMTAVALTALAMRMDAVPVEAGPRWMRWVGMGAIVFGWLYPHFLPNDGVIAHLVAAPLGVVPCPTLAAVTGFALLAGGLHGRSWALLLAAVGCFYALFGMFRLGVWLDVGLLLASCALGLAAVRRRGTTERMADAR